MLTVRVVYPCLEESLSNSTDRKYRCGEKIVVVDRYQDGPIINLKG
jgi:hypothetical protein